MEMEMEVKDELSVSPLVERLMAAAGALEQAAERFAGREIDLEATLDRTSVREAHLERLLAEAEAQIAALKGGRKTQAGGVTALVAKDGSAVEAGALDAALASLSLEQRITVKSQMLRAGLLG